jgi:conjugative transfer signal peptidase TraF
MLVLTSGIVASSIIGIGSAGLRVNVTPSMPVGIYWATVSSGAALVEFCPEEPFARESRKRHYRPYGVVCRDGGASLVKPVVARSGDIVEVNEAGIAVNGNRLPATVTLAADSEGRALTPWPHGNYLVAADELWVASPGKLGSYDSRYMGPIRKHQVIGGLVPLWVLE